MVSKWHIISEMSEKVNKSYLHNSTPYTARSKNCKYLFKHRSTTAKWYIARKVAMLASVVLGDHKCCSYRKK